MKPENMEYLGDGAYVEFDGFAYILKANHHLDEKCTDRIVLEPQVLAALNRFAARMKEIR